MSEDKDVKMVPAICTQCGGTLTVNPRQETADCPFCGASFVVQKAINNYQVKQANFEHVDNVNIDMKGTVHEVLDFVGEQMSESRKMKQEFRREDREREAENQKQFIGNFFRIAVPFFVIFFIFAGVMMFFFDKADGNENSGGNAPAGEEEGVSYEVVRGRLYIDIPDPGENYWNFDIVNSRGTSLEETKENNGLHMTIAADDNMGTGYAVLYWESEENSYYKGYVIYEVEIEDKEITEVIDVSEVSDLSEYTF